MKRRNRERGEPTQRVSYRLPRSLAEQIKRNAAAAIVDETEYVTTRLKGQNLPVYPALATLGRLMEIHRIAKAGNISPDLVGELRDLVVEIARIAHGETGN